LAKKRQHARPKADSASTAVAASSRPQAGLPDGWRMVKFGDVVKNATEVERDPLGAGLERFVGLDDIEPGNLHIKSWGLVADGTSFTRRFRKGQVLFAKRRAYQRKVAVAEFDGVCSSDILTFEPKGDDLIPDLLPFIVQSDGFFDHALGTSAGSLSPRTRWSQLKTYEFPLPPKDEQRRIAEILWAADEVLQGHLEAGRDFARTRATLLAQLYPASQDKRGVLQADRALRYAQWERVKLAVVVVDGAQTGLYKGRSAYGSGIEMVHMGDLFASDALTNGGMQRVKLTRDELARYGLEEGDLLFARRSIVPEGAGKCSIVKSTSEPLVFESSLIRVRPDRARVIPRFLAYWFQSAQGKRTVRRITRWGAVTGVTGSDLLRIHVPIAPLAHQQTVVRLIDEIGGCMEAAQSHSDVTREFNKRLRERLLGRHGNVASIW